MAAAEDVASHDLTPMQKQAKKALDRHDRMQKQKEKVKERLNKGGSDTASEPERAAAPPVKTGSPVEQWNSAVLQDILCAVIPACERDSNTLKPSAQTERGAYGAVRDRGWPFVERRGPDQ